jgi:hypothetical protein
VISLFVIKWGFLGIFSTWLLLVASGGLFSMPCILSFFDLVPRAPIRLSTCKLSWPGRGGIRSSSVVAFRFFLDGSARLEEDSYRSLRDASMLLSRWWKIVTKFGLDSGNFGPPGDSLSKECSASRTRYKRSEERFVSQVNSGSRHCKKPKNPPLSHTKAN